MEVNLLLQFYRSKSSDYTIASKELVIKLIISKILSDFESHHLGSFGLFSKTSVPANLILRLFKRVSFAIKLFIKTSSLAWKNLTRS